MLPTISNYFLGSLCGDPEEAGGAPLRRPLRGLRGPVEGRLGRALRELADERFPLEAPHRLPADGDLASR